MRIFVGCRNVGPMPSCSEEAEGVSLFSQVLCSTSKATWIRMKATRACQTKVVLPLATKYVGRGKAYIWGNKSCGRVNVGREERLDSFDVAA